MTPTCVTVEAILDSLLGRHSHLPNREPDESATDWAGRAGAGSSQAQHCLVEAIRRSAACADRLETDRYLALADAALVADGVEEADLDQLNNPDDDDANGPASTL